MLVSPINFYYMEVFHTQDNVMEYIKFNMGGLQGNTQDPVASSSPSAGSIAVVLYGIVLSFFLSPLRLLYSFKRVLIVSSLSVV